jgi:1-aminocyclopropane-1-carboxylate deaminase/D-cysteine desulfhydrase-like pyridoxal-dependent ACC family enzyme
MGRELTRQGQKPFILPIGGVGLGALGYVKSNAELSEQLEDKKFR